MMGTLLQDLRFGARMLVKNPGFTAVAVFALALGVGINTAIFSLINFFLLSPLPFAQPQQLVAVWETNQQKGLDRNPVSYPNFVDFQRQNQVFESLAAYGTDKFALSSDGQDAELVMGARVSASLFPLLRAQPLNGRTFLPEEDQPGSNRVVVVSHGLWQRRFGSDPRLVGSLLSLDGEKYTVIGIMPSDFKFPLQGQTDLWTPLAQDANPDARGYHFLSVIGRLKPGVTLEGARAEVGTIARRLEQDYPGVNSGMGANVLALQEDLVQRGRPALYLLMAIVAFVLLIACANVANLLLARAAARQKEIAIRIATGATRARLVRQLLTEGLLLGLLSGLLGFLLAVIGLGLLLSSLPDVPTNRNIGLDANVLIFTLLISVVAAVLFSLVPALQASKPDLNEWLKEGGRSSGAGGGGRSLLRNLLVISEVALSLILLSGAGLMIRSFIKVQQVDPGFTAAHVLVTPLSLPQVKYTEDEQRLLFIQQAVQRIGTLPTVQAVAATTLLPLSGVDITRSFNVEGHSAQAAGSEALTGTREVTPDYFRVMNIPLVKGRTFTEQDTADSPLVAIINQTMARRFFANEDPLGKRITIENAQSGPWCTIVGVVGDVRHNGLYIEPEPEMYRPLRQAPSPNVSVVLRTAGDPGQLAAGVRNEMRNLDSSIPVYDMKTMEQVQSGSITPFRNMNILISSFAIVALVLAVMGLFAFMSYSVVQRTHEIGIRMALGARQSNIVQLILKQGLKLVLIGVVIGLIGGALLNRVMASVLYGVGAADLITFASISILLLTSALLAIFIPAYQATKVDPMIALRHE